MPPAEHVHWMFATGFLLLGLFLLAEVIAGEKVWRRRPWRPYLWPSFLFLMGVLMWPVMTFFTNSTIHMVAHGSWAQVMMFAGAAELGLVRGKLHSPLWRRATPVAFVVPRRGSKLDAQALLSWANEQLGKVQRISDVRFTDELPRSPIGKVLKRELRDAYRLA